MLLVFACHVVCQTRCGANGLFQSFQKFYIENDSTEKTIQLAQSKLNQIYPNQIEPNLM